MNDTNIKANRMNQIANKELSLGEAVAEMVGGRQHLNYFTHLDADIGFLYLATPVVANVRTIGSLNMAVAQTMGVDFTYDKSGQVFKRKYNLIANPYIVGFPVFEQMLIDPRIIKFTFLRDPAERFAATYKNSFSINLRNGEPRKILFNHLGISDSENLSMLDLAELICEEEDLKSLLPRLQTQRVSTAFDLIEYDFIGRHETWNTDYATVASEIFGNKTPMFDPIKMFNQDPEGVELNSPVEPETLEAIRQAYAEDYEMLEEVAELYPDGFLHQEG